MFALLQTYRQPRLRGGPTAGPVGQDEVAGLPGFGGAVVLATQSGDARR